MTPEDQLKIVQLIVDLNLSLYNGRKQLADLERRLELALEDFVVVTNGLNKEKEGA